MIFETAKTREWWALVDDLRTLPLGQIVVGISQVGGGFRCPDSNEEHGAPVLDCPRASENAPAGDPVPVPTCPVIRSIWDVAEF